MISPFYILAMVLTIGHSTRSLETFVTLLQQHRVEEVVDVRRYPGSRRYPHFTRETLSLALAAEGIDYRHEPDLGGRRQPRPDSRHTAWRSAAFRGYADHMDTPEFSAALERLIRSAAERTVAIMCAEAVPWRCHRQLLADALLARGAEVRHVMDARAPEPHKLSRHARVAAGRPEYPRVSGSGDLFDGREERGS
jgi:uncharacterized protein (DUF488 family)